MKLRCKACKRECNGVFCGVECMKKYYGMKNRGEL